MGFNSKLQKTQQDLIDLGYDLGPYGADGFYGEYTDAAMRDAAGLDRVPGAVPTALDSPRDPIYVTPQKHFTWKEVKSNTEQDGRVIRDAIMPPEELIPNVLEIAGALEELRSFIGDVPIKVLSWYRDPEYNDYLHKKDPDGVSKNSKHKQGIAVDIAVDGMAPQQLYDNIELLFPRCGLHAYSWGVHFDLAKDQNGQIRLARW